MPPHTLIITAAIDVQHDRLEITFPSHGRAFAIVLSHVVIWGSRGDDFTWAKLDQLSGTTSTHPNGGTIKVDATAANSGDGAWSAWITEYCRARCGCEILAIKGVAGN